MDNISHGKPSAEPSSLKASQSSNSANIRTDVEETKQKLNVLAEKWKGVNSVKGFLTELWAALGIDAPTKGQQRGGNPSRYAAFRLQDGSVVIVTIRASAHNADASNYSKEGNVNGDTNLSLVLQKRWKKNKFKPSVNVKLDEYVYVDDRIKSVENPLTQIANSLIGYLTNGKYVDTTGVAITHNSPTIKESKTRIDMKQNKKTINEAQLRAIVSEAVKNVLREAYTTEPKGTRQQMAQYIDIPDSFSSDYYKSLPADEPWHKSQADGDYALMYKKLSDLYNEISEKVKDNSIKDNKEQEYFDKTLDCLRRACNYCHHFIRVRHMNMGVTPPYSSDSDY